MMERRLYLTGNVPDLARKLEKIGQEVPQETTRLIKISHQWFNLKYKTNQNSNNKIQHQKEQNKDAQNHRCFAETKYELQLDASLFVKLENYQNSNNKIETSKNVDVRRQGSLVLSIARLQNLKRPNIWH
ncbi:hypothetical protein TNCV_3738801 [Trichonephila clavipes]|nr:hypothetical protein TNCV_3738801 [Trichonephila clavipes]